MIPGVHRPSISAFFPCYNDEKTIGTLVLHADELLRSLTDDYEIIVVNDGSLDNSAGVLQGLLPRPQQHPPPLMTTSTPSRCRRNGALSNCPPG